MNYVMGTTCSTPQEILVGVTGSIAAYKAIEIVSGLKKSGFAVTVALTPSALKFVTPLTFEILSGKEVYSEVFAEKTKVSHIEIAARASLFLVAPATANFIAKAAHGIADDPVTLLYLSSNCPVVIAPAMNERMFNHPAVQENLETLMRRGVIIVSPEEGRLACGSTGKGRLASVEKIISTVEKLLKKRSTLKGKTVLVTAGPTQEKIDEIRYISNYSSGKTGYALAAEAFKRGAQVELISGPTNLEPPPGVNVTYVKTALEMRKACLDIFFRADITIMAAAVADYRPVKKFDGKLKKSHNLITLELVENPDILKELSSKKKKTQLIVGFAAETSNLLENAQVKLQEKKVDLLVANLVGDGKGFGQDFNQVTLLFSDGRKHKLPLLPKEKVAEKIFDQIEKILSN